MPSSESLDVSWPDLRQIIRTWAGSAADIAELRHLHGGSISTTLGLLLTDGSKAVMKIAAHRVDRSLLREAQQLAHLRMLGIPVPTVYQWRLADLDCPHSYLVLEHCPGMDLAKARENAPPETFESLQKQLADIVLRLHLQTGTAYMRVGETGLEDTEYKTWPEFFAHIYEPMWNEVEKCEQTSKSTRKAFQKIHAAIPTLLTTDDPPRLVHWDLWSGNILAAPSGDTWQITAILDPMLKYAHHEAELAYLELFSTVTPTFLKEYKQHLRPPDAYAKLRRPLYHLYHQLDHAAFFGGPYHAKFADQVEKVAALI